MDETLVRAGKRLQERVDRTAMIAVGGVDHGIGTPGFGREDRGIVEAAHDRLDTEDREFPALLRVANETADLVAIVEQAACDGAADIAGRAGHEDLHGHVS